MYKDKLQMWTESLPKKPHSQPLLQLKDNVCVSVVTLILRRFKAPSEL